MEKFNVTVSFEIEDSKGNKIPSKPCNSIRVEEIELNKDDLKMFAYGIRSFLKHPVNQGYKMANENLYNKNYHKLSEVQILRPYEKANLTIDIFPINSLSIRLRMISNELLKLSEVAEKTNKVNIPNTSSVEEVEKKLIDLLGEMSKNLQ